MKQLRSRLLVRSWEYRQRRHARGTWFRLRRVLADARAAYVVSPEEAGILVAEGHAPQAVGEELEPRKLIVFASPGRVARLGSARPVPVRLGADLLAAGCLVLTPFEKASDRALERD